MDCGKPRMLTTVLEAYTYNIINCLSRSISLIKNLNIVKQQETFQAQKYSGKAAS